MICPECGTSMSDVAATKSSSDFSVVIRRRECFNGHRYDTFEVSRKLAESIDSICDIVSKSSVQSRSRGARNARIVARYKTGETMESIGRSIGISTSQVRKIINKEAPGVSRGRRRANVRSDASN